MYSHSVPATPQHSEIGSLSHAASHSFKATPVTPPVFFWGQWAYIALVTPDLARAWLALMGDANIRKASKSRIRKYVAMIKDKSWTPDSGDRVIFNLAGLLVNGQHRLQAIIDADEPMFMWICEGMRDEAIANVDRGFNRDNRTFLKKSKGPVGEVLSPICARVVQREQRAKTAKEGDSLFAGKMPHDGSPCPAQCERALREHPTIMEAANRVAHLRTSRLRGALIGYVLFQGMREAGITDWRIADDFLHGLETGANLSDGDARLHYRNLMLGRDAKLARLNADHTMCLLIKTWNAFVEERQVNQLRHAARSRWPEFSKRATIQPR